MHKTFISALTEFIDANGKKILDQPDRFKSLFLDFSQNEYRAEAQIFSQFLASNQARELKNSEDVDAAFLKAVSQRFEKAHLFNKDICELVVLAYAWFLGLIDKRTFEAGLGGDNTQPEPQAKAPETRPPMTERPYTRPQTPVPPPAQAAAPP